jgi:hypothetical protein
MGVSGQIRLSFASSSLYRPSLASPRAAGSSEVEAAIRHDIENCALRLWPDEISRSKKSPSIDRRRITAA